MTRFALGLACIAVLAGSSVPALGQGAAPVVTPGGIAAPSPTARAFYPQTPTVWHRLGVPQSKGLFRQWRDSRINRDGFNPQKEKKPKLKKLTDPSNFAPEAPGPVKAAAKMKQAEDQAPQKIKALRYIGKMGCACYNKKFAGEIEAAMLEAMEDCTPEVRIAAMQVFCSTASCNCSVCNSKSCCTEKVTKLLQKIAFEVDDNGCPYEPNETVRSLAEQALTMCPPLEPEMVIPKDGEMIPEDGETASSRNYRNRLTAQNFDEYYGGVSMQRTTGPSAELTNSTDKKVGSLVSASLTDQNDTMVQQLAVSGRVGSINLEEGQVGFVFDKNYRFPAQMRAVFTTNESDLVYGTIVEGETGVAIIQVDDPNWIDQVEESQPIRFGIIQ